MRLTVLGKSPSWQDVDGACSGYLLEENGVRVLLDCGNGVFAKMRRFVDYVDLDAVVISHLHADHILDLVPFSYALTYAPRQQPVAVDRWPGTDHPARPRLYAPPGARDHFRHVCELWGNPALVENAFQMEEYDPTATIAIGSMKVSFSEVPHFVDTFAVSVRSGDGGGRLAYGADSRPAEELVEFARDADLFLVEATLPRPERTGIRGHLTPEEAGQHAKQAGARRVLLTHISDELDQDKAREAASDAFGGPVEMAVEGAVYEI